MWPKFARIALAALALRFAAIAQQPPTIRVLVRIVSLPTLVFSKDNQLIPGLQKTDFRVFDNDRLQTTALDANSTPVSLAIAVQVNQDVRSYVPFIAKAASIVDALLAGESGDAAVITYADDIAVAKPFDAGDLPSALQSISAGGDRARMIDAAVLAVTLLKRRPRSRERILLLIGQPMDSGSAADLAWLTEQAERENVTVYALALPEAGKAFVTDTFSLQGVGRGERGGFKAGVDLGRLIGAINKSGDARKGADPFSILTAATGGFQFHLRRQRQLEGAIAAMGVALRSAYLLSYDPSVTEAGYHTVKVDVAVPGATAHARPGYWLGAE